jgi:hypothetical protein
MNEITNQDHSCIVHLHLRCEVKVERERARLKARSQMYHTLLGLVSHR